MPNLDALADRVLGTLKKLPKTLAKYARRGATLRLQTTAHPEAVGGMAKRSARRTSLADVENGISKYILYFLEFPKPGQKSRDRSGTIPLAKRFKLHDKTEDIHAVTTARSFRRL